MENRVLNNLLKSDVKPLVINEISQQYIQKMAAEIRSGTIETESVFQCVCGSKKVQQLTRVDRFGLPFGSYLCRECSLIFRSPRLTQNSIPYYYETYYHPINYGKVDLSGQTALFKAGQGKKIFHLVSEFITAKREIAVLEVGAGTGSVLREFREEGLLYGITVNVLGTEYSSACIKQCENNGVSMIYGGLESLGLERQKFDLIILSHVFEHFIDLQAVLKKLKTLLSEEGIVYIEVPGIYAIHRSHYYDFSFVPYTTHAHMYDFISSSLNNVVEGAGFSNLYSNETVEAVYRVGNLKNRSTAEKSYENILFYLSFLEENYPYFKNNYERTKYLLGSRNGNVNYDFSHRMNHLNAHLFELKKQYQRIALYGNGVVGKFLHHELDSSIVVIVDQLYDQEKGIYPPKYLADVDFECVVIAVLGREEEIKTYLSEIIGIEKNKIIELKLG
jgi:2-polyprenyl-3-methyl-5-hydroxy-6-metoxy-1,4-benzoquinol methylase